MMTRRRTQPERLKVVGSTPTLGTKITYVSGRSRVCVIAEVNEEPDRDFVVSESERKKAG